MDTIAGVVLGAFLIISSVMHWVTPRFYYPHVPAWVPWPRFMVWASGLAGVVIGAAILFPQTRMWAAIAAALLIISYLPVHLELLRIPVAQRKKPRSVTLRLIANLIYIGWAIAVAVYAT